MVTALVPQPHSSDAALGPLADGLSQKDRDLLAQALEFAQTLYADEALSTGEPI